MTGNQYTTRRDFLKKTVLGAAALSLPVHAIASAAGSKKKTNVLFIAVDDLRPELGCYGNKLIKSPGLDRLAAEGTLFERAYCQQAVCAPSRVSLLSGCRPDTTKVTDLQSPLRTTRPDLLTLPRLFKQHGYQAASLGKIYHHRGPQGDDPQSWSCPEWEEKGSWKGRGYLSPEAQAQINTGPRKGVGVGPATEAADVADTDYRDGAIADEAIARLRKFQADDQPFFLAVGFKKPHLPFNAPLKYWKMYDPDKLYRTARDTWPQSMPSLAKTGWGELRGYTDIPDKTSRLSDEMAKKLIHGYYACVTYVDAQIGRVISALEALGLRDNTVIVLWGDHGWKLNDYGAWCKHTNLEIDTHVPLLLSAPGYNKNQRSKALVEFVDIYPTLAELCDLEIPPHCEGTSMVPLLNDPARDWKKAAFSQYPRGKFMGYSMRCGQWRYTEWLDEQGDVLNRELYDHSNGPLADKNLAGEPKYKEIVKELSAILNKGKGWKSFQEQG